MTRLLLIGSVGSGKSTLRQRLTGKELQYEKTQTTIVSDNVFDTPGEYMDHGWMRHSLQLTSVDCDIVLLLLDPTAPFPRIPPGFSSFFTKPLLGLITKIDIAEREQVDHARLVLAMSGAAAVHEISSVTGKGIDEVVEEVRVHVDR